MPEKLEPMQWNLGSEKKAVCSPEQHAEETAQHAGILEDVCGKGFCVLSMTEKREIGLEY